MYLLEIPDLNESVQKYERKSSIGKMATEWIDIEKSPEFLS